MIVKLGSKYGNGVTMFSVYPTWQWDFHIVMISNIALGFLPQMAMQFPCSQNFKKYDNGINKGHHKPIMTIECQNPYYNNDWCIKNKTKYSCNIFSLFQIKKYQFISNNCHLHHISINIIIITHTSSSSSIYQQLTHVEPIWISIEYPQPILPTHSTPFIIQSKIVL